MREKRRSAPENVLFGLGESALFTTHAYSDSLTHTNTQMQGRGTSRYRYALPIGIKFHTKAGATISKHTEREASKRNSEWNL